MGKKGKKEKKGKTSIPVEPKRPQIDPEVLKELTKDLQDVFKFPNGDVYVGHIAVTPEGKISRDGRGKYFSEDGCVTSGRWEDDVLVEAERISYPDGSWYTGQLEGGKYSGPGSYHFPSLGTLEGVFVQGRPQGLVTLTDPDGNKWQGHAVGGALTLLPINHFFDSEDALLRARTLKHSGSLSITSNRKSIASEKET